MLCWVVSRFSNPALQALLVLAKKQPPRDGAKLLVIGTTSEADFIRVSSQYFPFSVFMAFFFCILACFILLFIPFLVSLFLFLSVFVLFYFCLPYDNHFCVVAYLLKYRHRRSCKDSRRVTSRHTKTSIKCNNQGTCG